MLIIRLPCCVALASQGTFKDEATFEEFFTKLHTTDKFDSLLKGAQTFAAQLGVTTLPSLFVNGRLYAGDPADPSGIIKQLPYTLREQYPVLVEEVRAQRITDDDDVLAAFCTQPTTRTRILPAFDTVVADSIKAPWLPALLAPQDQGGAVPHTSPNYAFPTQQWATNTHFVVVDLEAAAGLQLLLAVLEHVRASKGTSRAAVFLNPPLAASTVSRGGVISGWLTPPLRPTTPFAGWVARSLSCPMVCLSRGTGDQRGDGAERDAQAAAALQW